MKISDASPSASGTAKIVTLQYAIAIANREFKRVPTCIVRLDSRHVNSPYTIGTRFALLRIGPIRRLTVNRH